MQVLPHNLLLSPIQFHGADISISYAINTANNILILSLNSWVWTKSDLRTVFPNIKFKYI